MVGEGTGCSCRIPTYFEVRRKRTLFETTPVWHFLRRLTYRKLIHRWSVLQWVQRNLFHRLTLNFTACTPLLSVHPVSWPARQSGFGRSFCLL